MLQLRTALKGCDQSEQKEIENKIHQSLVSIVSVLPPVEGALSILSEKLHKLKDQRVFKNLLILCASDSDSRKIREAKVSLMRRSSTVEALMISLYRQDYVLKSLGTKTSIGEYVKMMIRKCAMATVNTDTIENLITYMRTLDQSSKKKNQKQSSTLVSALELIRV